MSRYGWILVLAGCPSGSGGSDEISNVAFVPADVPGVGTITFATERTGDAHVVYGLTEDSLDLTSPTSDAAAGAVQVRGLRLGIAQFAKVVIESDGETLESAPIEFTVDPPPAGVPSFELNAWDPTKSCLDGGYVMFSYLGQNKSGVGVLDREGKYVWAVASDDGEMQIGRVRPGRDGQSVLYNRFDESKSVDKGEIIRISFDGSSTLRTRTIYAHHDFVELPSGDLAWLAYDRRDAPGYTLPDDPQCDDIVVGSGGELPISAEALYVGPEGLTDTDASTAVQLWNQWDDDPSGVTPLTEDVCSFLKDGSVEAAHANSLVHREAAGDYLIGMRWLSMVTAIADDGAFKWNWGGPSSDLTGDPADLFVRSHFSEAWDGGMLMFDNRAPPSEPSHLVEYTFDDTSYAKVWDYDLGSHEELLGDVRFMPIEGCDNVIASFSQQGRLVEVTRDGEIVWDVGAKGIGNVTSRVFFVPDLYDLNSARPY